MTSLQATLVDGRLLWGWLLLTGLLLLWPDAQVSLRYERIAVDGGAWWRLITANLVHSNGWHWLLNAAGAAFQFWLFQGLGNGRQWLAVALLCLLGNVLGLHWFSPALDWYVGMSGALYGTAAVGGLWLLARREWLVGSILSGYLPLRIGYEQWGGSTAELAALIEVPVAVDAHLWGLVSGYLAALLLLLWSRARTAPGR